MLCLYRPGLNCSDIALLIAIPTPSISARINPPEIEKRQLGLKTGDTNTLVYKCVMIQVKINTQKWSICQYICTIYNLLLIFMLTIHYRNSFYQICIKYFHRYNYTTYIHRYKIDTYIDT